MGFVHSWGGRLAGESAGWWWEVMSVQYPRLGEASMGGRQLQVWGAAYLLVVVVKWFGGEVAVQIPFLQIQMQGWSGTIWTCCQFTGASCTHWRHGVAVSINIRFTGVVCCCGGRCSKLLLATEALWVDVNPFEHVNKFVGWCLLGFGVFTLATDPGKGWHSEDKAKDTHHCYTHWHCHCDEDRQGGRRGEIHFNQAYSKQQQLHNDTHTKQLFMLLHLNRLYYCSGALESILFSWVTQAAVLTKREMKTVSSWRRIIITVFKFQTWPTVYQQEAAGVMTVMNFC